MKLTLICVFDWCCCCSIFVKLCQYLTSYHDVSPEECSICFQNLIYVLQTCPIVFFQMKSKHTNFSFDCCNSERKNKERKKVSKCTQVPSLRKQINTNERAGFTHSSTERRSACFVNRANPGSEMGQSANHRQGTEQPGIGEDPDSHPFIQVGSHSTKHILEALGLILLLKCCCLQYVTCTE